MSDFDGGKFTAIVPKTLEFSKMEYLLQLSLGTVTAVVTRMWGVARPALSQLFQKHVTSKNMPTVYSFIDVSTLDKGTSLESIINNNFDLTQEGRKFTTGLFKLGKSGATSYRVLCCKVAIGKTLCCPTTLKESEEKVLMAENRFHSILVPDEGKKNFEFYRYTYEIFNKEYVLPEYIIDFTFKEDLEKNLQTEMCQNKCSTAATIYCENDNAVFCSNCDTTLHSTEYAREHKRVGIHDRPKSFGNCEHHKDQKYQFFCNKCRQLLCIYCKINGSHSTGDAASHELRTISEEFNIAVKNSKEADSSIEKYKGILRGHLKSVRENIDVIKANAQRVESELYKILETALENLHSLAQVKLTKLLADEVELRRRYEEIQWTQSFLRHQHEVLEPQNFLKSWFRHLERKSELISSGSTYNLTPESADLDVTGKIAVTSASILRTTDENFKNPRLDPTAGDISKDLILKGHEAEGRKNRNPKDRGNIPQDSPDSVLQSKTAKADSSQRAFTLMDTSNQATNKWSEKLRMPVNDKSEKRGVGGLDQSVKDQTETFAAEASRRYTALKKYMTDEFLSKVFKGSEILQENDKEGKRYSPKAASST